MVNNTQEYRTWLCSDSISCSSCLTQRFIICTNEYASSSVMPYKYTVSRTHCVLSCPTNTQCHVHIVFCHALQIHSVTYTLCSVMPYKYTVSRTYCVLSCPTNTVSRTHCVLSCPTNTQCHVHIVFCSESDLLLPLA